MEMYFIKSAACLAILLLFYKLLLEKENMHDFKRFYLLASAVTAIGIPFITITTYVDPAPEYLNSFIYSSITSSEIPVQTINYWPYILFGIYLLGVFFFTIKFCRNLRGLIKKIRTNPKLKSGNFINVLLSEKIHPHTFFSFIFFNREKYLLDQIPKDVKIHEEAHASQKHSLDVLLVELLQIIYWFNPLIFLLKDAMKLNHEFLADREVIKKGIPTSRYQQTLLAYSSGDLQSDLVNPINYSSIKKRFSVMKTKTSKTVIWGKGLLLLPIMTLLIYGFSTREIVERDIEKTTFIIENSTVLAPNIESFQDKATPEMMNEYTDLVNFYNNKSKDCPTIRQDDAIKIKHVLSKMTTEQLEKAVKLKCKFVPPPSEKSMTPEQKEKAEKINFNVPPPPPPPTPVEAVQIWVEEGATFFYNGRSISGKEALEMVHKNNGKNLSVHVEENNSQKTIKLSDKKDTVPPPPPPPKTPSAENGFYYTAAQSPPSQNSNTLEYVLELAKRGANFYIGPHEYSLEEVIKMVKKSTNDVSIDVSKYPDVKLGGC